VGIVSVRDFLHMVAGEEAAGYLEIRHRQPDGIGMAQKFFAVADVDACATMAEATGQLLDCWVGMAPRVRPSGRSVDVERAWIISADCDSDTALDRLQAFEPAPTAIIASGSRTQSGRPKVHAHWALAEPVGRDELEARKRGLAVALDSDRAISDAARIMRVPGTRNHKNSPPTEVRTLVHVPERRYRAGDVVGRLEEAPRAEPQGERGDDGAVRDPETGAVLHVDPLLTIAPSTYVRVLTGQEVNRADFVQCPFHDDWNPSLKVYDRAKRGWFCFQCRRGGDIYSLAAHLAGVFPPRGNAFIALRDSLRETFGMTPPRSLQLSYAWRRS
jgi:hypothetical protein